MFFHTVIKHVRCLPCQHLIDVRKFRTTQGSETEADAALQKRIIEGEINSRKLLGFYICPKCLHKASITDPPIVFWDDDGNLLRDAKGNPIRR